MSLPLSILRAVGIISISIQSFAQEASPPHQFWLVWPGGEKSPAVCVGKPDWFIGVVPAFIDLATKPVASVELPGEILDTALLHLDLKSRLCLFESKSKAEKIKPLPLSKEKKLMPGEKMHCPTGSGKCMSTFTGKEWSYRGHNFESPLLHLRLADLNQKCQPGTPLINSKGELEGIVTAHQISAENEAFAIPASRINKLITEIKHHRKSGPVWVGLLFHAESSSPEVMEVKADSPSRLAGIEQGDIILGVNGDLVEDLNDLVEVMQNLPAGKEATFRLLRGVGEMSVTLTPQFAAASLADNQ